MRKSSFLEILSRDLLIVTSLKIAYMRTAIFLVDSWSGRKITPIVPTLDKDLTLFETPTFGSGQNK